METNLFELIWDDWDGSDNYLFLHSNKTQEEFNSDVKLLLKKYGKEYIDSNIDQFVGADGWISFIVPKMSELGYIPAIPMR
jgi:hypothetical protein